MDRIEYTSFVATSSFRNNSFSWSSTGSLALTTSFIYTPALFLLPTPDSDRSFKSESPTGAIAGALVGVMVVVVAAIAVVLLVVLVLRRRQRKIPHGPDTQERTVDNAIYAGNNLWSVVSSIYRQSNIHGVWRWHECIFSSLVPRPLLDFISQLWRNSTFLHSCKIKSGSMQPGNEAKYSLLHPCFYSNRWVLYWQEVVDSVSSTTGSCKRVFLFTV